MSTRGSTAARAWAFAFAVAMSALCAPAGVHAADPYPSRPVKLIVPYPAGGAVDSPARILAQQLSTQTGQPFIVENRPGAGGNIGVDLVVGAPPDGYTLLLGGPNLTISPVLTRETTRFDANTSFTPVAEFVTVPTVIAVAASSKLRSLADMLADAKKRPGALSYASPGNGSPSHLAMELFKFRAGVDIRHIPYRGSAPAIVDVLGEQVDLLVSTLAAPLEHIRSGKLRGLAVTSSARAPELPDVPAVSEAIPGFELVTWMGVLGPKGLDASVKAKLEQEVAKALNDSATQQRLREAGTSPHFQGAESLERRLKSESELYRKLIADAKVKVD